MNRFSRYVDKVKMALSGTECTDVEGCSIDVESGITWACDSLQALRGSSNKIMFVGNGGSMGIASHLAIDFSQNGGIAALAFSDAAALTCISNDLSYEKVFSTQIDIHAGQGDVLVSISSSGQSANILNAVVAARARGCIVLTLSGFSPENPLRALGDINFYTPSFEYGFVEISHTVLCHAILDFVMGWNESSTNDEYSDSINKGV